MILFFFNHRFHGKNVSVTYFLEPFTGISYNIKVATILLRSNVLSDYMEGRFATCVDCNFVMDSQKLESSIALFLNCDMS